MKEDIIEFLFGTLVGLCSWFFGGIDGFVMVLITLTIVDYITGICKAGIRHEISSEVGFKGIAKKIVIFSLVGVAHLLDKYMLGNTEALRTAVCLFYIGNEGISILENADALGVPFPEVMKKKFLSMENKDEEEINS